ncbi:heavy-metal-associated domain-containing protein [Aestuariibaculum suncheonense]|uniref:Heavy-metal-associated domain-containing protein n=1 Tax=Aestuariibaculum suncheonense TaxID=1028745 RepID=A0A8J6Q6Z0_9FLAO|nr:heavy-metal-associated domain-containing protein [Aestuariibaculum suncheonense]MBD0835417.1 heavy-metal-associated domain-containing protein [Aestuariibaculum suncheonense]
MQTTIIIQNLKCGGCANTITNNLENIDEISDIQIDLEKSTVSFNCDNEIGVVKVETKLKALGYPSIEDENSFSSKAKSFVSCATGKFSK